MHLALLAATAAALAPALAAPAGTTSSASVPPKYLDPPPRPTALDRRRDTPVERKAFVNGGRATRDTTGSTIRLASRPRHADDSWNPDLRLLRAHLDTRSRYAGLLDERGRELLKRDWAAFHAHRDSELERRGVEPAPPADGFPTILRNWKADRIYSLPVRIGTPAQDFSVTIDTGSAALWVYGLECNTSLCAGSSGYQDSLSATAGEPEGTMEIKYGQGTTEGHWIRDTVQLGGWAITDFEFGVAHAVVDQPWDGTDTEGILGLSWGMHGWAAPFWQSLAVQGAFNDARFGLYLARERDTRESTIRGEPVQEELGGSLTLGGVDAQVIAGEVNYIPVRETHGKVTFWRIPVEGYTINAHFEAVAIDGIVDSGTSFIYLPRADHDRFWALVPGARLMPLHEYGDNWKRYYAFPCHDSAALASLKISFSFGGVAYALEATDLIYQPIQQGSLDGYCIGAVLDGTGIVDNFDGAWLLGDALLKNVYSVYTYEPPMVGLARLKDEYNLRIEGMGWVNETAKGATLSPPPFGINQQTPTAVVTVPAARTDKDDDPTKNRIFSAARSTRAHARAWAETTIHALVICSTIHLIF